MHIKLHLHVKLGCLLKLTELPWEDEVGLLVRAEVDVVKGQVVGALVLPPPHLLLLQLGACNLDPLLPGLHLALLPHLLGQPPGPLHVLLSLQAPSVGDLRGHHPPVLLHSPGQSGTLG